MVVDEGSRSGWLPPLTPFNRDVIVFFFKTMRFEKLEFSIRANVFQKHVRVS